MLKRDEKGQEWIVSDVKILKNSKPIQSSIKVFVDDVYCGQYQDLSGDGKPKEVKCFKPVKGNSIRLQQSLICEYEKL